MLGAITSARYINYLMLRASKKDEASKKGFGRDFLDG